MINVTLVTNNGAGLPTRIKVVPETTLERFLEVHFGNTDEYKIRVRANGISVQAHNDYVLQDGDRVSLVQSKVEGGTENYSHLSFRQLQDIREKAQEVVMGEATRGVYYLKSIVNTYLNNLTVREMLYEISTDEDAWPDLLGFDPKTGGPWGEY